MTMPLTKREREIVALYQESHTLTYREVGERLGISANTVKVHISRIVGRLHSPLPAKAALIAFAQELNETEADRIARVVRVATQM